MGITFKETKIGQIPEEWELHQAKRVAFVNMGQSPSSSDCNDAGIGVPFLQGNADFGDKYPKISSWTTNPTKIAKPNDILMSVRAPVGDINLADTECCIGRGLCAITPKSGADLLFLYYILKSSMPRLLRFQQGSTFLAINKQNIDSHLIPLPPLPEQRKIAEILATVDETIEKTDAIIQETQRLKKGLMQKLFTEGIGHTRLKETKVGWIPEGWDYDILGNVAKVKGGKRLPKGDQFAGTRTPYPYIRIVDFRNMSVAMGELKYLKEKTQKSIARYTISSSDVYISIAGTIGLVGIVPNELDGANLTENAAKICNLKKVNKVFLAYFLISPNAQKQIDSFIGISTQPKLALNRIEKIQLPIPDLDEQCKIAEILSEVDAKIEKDQAFKAELEQLKKGLMQVLLTGKVRVKV